MSNRAKALRSVIYKKKLPWSSKVLPDIRESCSEALDSQDEIDKILLMTCDGNVDYALKVERLQKTFNFLQERYKTLLTSLHEEVEELRKKNKGDINCEDRNNQYKFIFLSVELSFKLAMLVGQKQNSMNMKSERKLCEHSNLIPLFFLSQHTFTHLPSIYAKRLQNSVERLPT